MSCCKTEQEVIGHNLTSTKTFYFLGIPVWVTEYEQTSADIFALPEEEEEENAQF